VNFKLPWVDMSATFSEARYLNNLWQAVLLTDKWVVRRTSRDGTQFHVGTWPTLYQAKRGADRVALRMEANLRGSVARHEVLDHALQGVASGTPEYRDIVDELIRVESQIISAGRARLEEMNMGRELRRVPLDFDWPLNEVWKGFLNPHYRPCPKAATNECDGGYSNAGKWMDAICRFLSLIGEEAVLEPHATELQKRGRTYPHPYLRQFAQAPMTTIPYEVRMRLNDLDNMERERELGEYLRRNPPKLLTFTEELANFITALAGKKPEPPFGDISWNIQQALMKAAGIDPDSKWGVCKVCDGNGLDPEIREAFENWTPEPPPIGEGWQLWETVSEGAPYSPVFPTRKKFVAYLVGEGYSRSAAEKFCDVGWVVSCQMRDGVIAKNIETLDQDP